MIAMQILCRAVIRDSLLGYNFPFVVSLYTDQTKSNQIKPNQGSDIPVLFTHRPTSVTVTMIENYTAKLNADDSKRTDAVVDHYTKHIDHERILDIAGFKP